MIVSAESLAGLAAAHRRRAAREELLARVLANEIAALRPTSRLSAGDVRGVTLPLTGIKL